MKILLFILLISFVQFASAQNKNHDERLIGSWEFEIKDEVNQIEYSGLTQFLEDGKFESLITLNDGETAENYAGEGIWWTKKGIVHFKYVDETETSQSYEIIDENKIRLKELKPSDTPILDDLIYERIP